MSGLACTLQKPPACVQAARPGYFSGVLAGPVGAVNSTAGRASLRSLSRVGEHCRLGGVVLNLDFVSVP